MNDQIKKLNSIIEIQAKIISEMNESIGNAAVHISLIHNLLQSTVENNKEKAIPALIKRKEILQSEYRKNLDWINKDAKTRNLYS